MAFVPRGYTPPRRLETPDFLIRPITYMDVVKDYEAVMSSREYLWGLFGDSWGWPAEDLSLEQDLIDLAWHQKEAQLNSSYNYAVMSPDESRLLGCLYLDPPAGPDRDVDVFYWIRTMDGQAGLEARLRQAAEAWIREAWCFERPAFPGR